MPKSMRDIVAHSPATSSPATPSVTSPEKGTSAELVAATESALHTGTQLKDTLTAMGPGMITGASDDDPSGIGTYSIAGAQFGFQMLWLSWTSFFLAAAVQEACARIGMVTGHGLATITKRHYGKAILFFVTFILVVANTANIGADIQAMSATINLVWPQLNFSLIAFSITLISLILVVSLPYRIYVRYLKIFALTLLSYAFVALISHTNWSSVLSDLFNLAIPLRSGLFNNPDYLLALIGVLGTTISPYMFFWQANEEVEEELVEGIIRKDDPTVEHPRLRHLTMNKMRAMRSDVISGMLYSNLIMFFIIVASATYLYKGIGSNSLSDLSISQLAEVLRPLAGDTAFALFAFGIVGVGMLAIPVLAGSASYAIAEMFDWKEGLNKRFTEAPGFYLIIISAVGIGLALNLIGISPVTALLYTAVLNGLAAAPLIFLIWIIGNNKKIMGDHANGLWSNILLFLALVTMAAASLAFIYITYFLR